MFPVFARIRNYAAVLKQNFQFLRQAVDQVGSKYEQLSLDELDMLLDNPLGVYEFELEHEGVRLIFTLDEWGPDKRTNAPGYCINVMGLPTLLGVKPGYHFYKNKDGSVFY